MIKANKMTTTQTKMNMKTENIKIKANLKYE